MKERNIVPSSYSGLFPILPAANDSMSAVAEDEVRGRITEVAVKIAQARGPQVTTNQIVMKWILKKGVFVVTTSTKRSRIEEYVRIDEVEDLSDEEAEQLQKAAAGKHLRSFVSEMRSLLIIYF